MSEKGDLILGKVNLNAKLYKKNQPCRVIEILDSEGNFDGEILVLKVLRTGDLQEIEK